MKNFDEEYLSKKEKRRMKRSNSKSIIERVSKHRKRKGGKFKPAHWVRAPKRELSISVSFFWIFIRWF
jgi:hypothetical protein